MILRLLPLYASLVFPPCGETAADVPLGLVAVQHGAVVRQAVELARREEHGEEEIALPRPRLRVLAAQVEPHLSGARAPVVAIGNVRSIYLRKCNAQRLDAFSICHAP